MGKTRYIGVSNFTQQHLTQLLTHAKIKPAVNQVEFHPFLFSQELLEYCTQQEIQLQAYSSLGAGSKELIEHPVVIEIAQHYPIKQTNHKHEEEFKQQGNDQANNREQAHKTPAQILLRWALQHGVGVIPKTIHESWIIENSLLFDFEINEEDMKKLDALHCNKRFCWDPTKVV